MNIFIDDSGGGGGAPTYRYWRLYITANDGDGNYTSMGELELINGSTDYLDGISGGEYDQSSANGSDYAIYLCDNNQGTEWVSASGSAVPSWVAFDLGAAVSLTEYRIRSQRIVTGRTPSEWLLQANNAGMGAGESWTTIDSRTGQTGWGVQEQRIFTL